MGSISEVVKLIRSPVRADGDWGATWREWWDATGFGHRTVKVYISSFRAYHTGLDLNHRSGIDLGRSVYAAADGVVCFVGKVRGWRGGSVIVIEHEFGDTRLWTRYAHVDPAVNQGQVVSAGEVIAHIADYPPKGRIGDHLHFDVAVCNLCNNPGLWPGLDLERLQACFVDPVLFSMPESESNDS